MNVLLRGIRGCACGRDHFCPIDCVAIGPDALSRLPELCAGYGGILLVCDENTLAACGGRVEQLISEKLTGTVCFSGKSVLIPDETALETVSAAVTPKTDLILGVGSGVINDICKQVSFAKDLPYFIVATAPSMDGYASVGAALILGGMKVTLNARPPKAILGDTSVLKDAPMEMLQAGWGDIVGKFSCLNDWKLAALLRGEYFCQRVWQLTYDTAVEVRALASGVLSRDPDAVGRLMEALVAVGIAMSFVGNSRPASGSEHHLSHFFEITGILEGKPYLPHGIDVLYSSVLTARLRETICLSLPHDYAFDRAAWEGEIRRIYSTSAPEVMALQDRLGWYEENEYDRVAAIWPEIRDLLREAPNEKEMRTMTADIGLDYDAFCSLYGEEKLKDAVLYAKDLKDRYTVLWLYYKYFR